ncbi:Asparagine-rich zinc finger protein AZF1 [Orchesella cincta]|uniref:Asparagine-rich zinc finger protein AZF1 n=1 Tax=Orchesella cincta TaxID=48709 RepID=A0A1D2M878_ORCCI|nr:Asparagine-rich zinc finger protein AZF1 [Orchesella cincta]
MIHRLTHTGEKAHKCHLCPRTFAVKGSLAGHLTAKHGVGIEMFKCELEGCGKVFISRKYFRVHRKNTHHLYTKKSTRKQGETD